MVVDEARGLFGGLGAGSGVIVEVEDERLKGLFARGARCVSFSSVWLSVRAQWVRDGCAWRGEGEGGDAATVVVRG